MAAGAYQEALQCFEAALQTLDSANLCNRNREEVIQMIRLVKRDLGLTNATDDVKECRERLANLATYDATNKTAILHAKMDLICAMKMVEPLEYFKIIKLLGEIVADCQRVLGPEHYNSIAMKSEHVRMKKMYTEYLQKLVSEKST